MVSKVLMLHENIDLLFSGDSYKLFLGNTDPTEGIILVLVDISYINQLGWLEVSKEY